MNKKISIILLSMTLLVTGCAKHEKVAKTNDYQQIVKTAKKSQKKQQLQQQKMPKSFYKQEASSVVEPPHKVSEYLNNKTDRSLVLKGVVTKWGDSQQYAPTGQVLTKTHIYIDKQYNMKEDYNLEGKTIPFYGNGGYATRGQIDNTIPDKSFAPKPKLTAQEKSEKVYIQDANLPIPQIGEQVLIMVRPFEISGANDASEKFNQDKIFSDKTNFITSQGNHSLFILNEKTKKYESKVIDNTGKTVSRSIDNKLDHSMQADDGLKELLNDINSNYL